MRGFLKEYMNVHFLMKCLVKCSCRNSSVFSFRNCFSNFSDFCRRVFVRSNSGFQFCRSRWLRECAADLIVFAEIRLQKTVELLCDGILLLLRLLHHCNLVFVAILPPFWESVSALSKLIYARQGKKEGFFVNFFLWSSQPVLLNQMVQ